MIYLILFWICVFFIGASIFSFINAAAFRIEKGENIAKGRSHCDYCNKKLKPWELIPIFSYIMIKARCTECGAKIGINHFITELIGGLLLLLCFYIYWFEPFKIITAFLFISILACIFIVDMNTMTIPNGLVMITLVIAIISIFAFKEVGIIERIIGFFNVSVVLLLITLMINGAFGGGDIKLMAATGVFLGWKMNFLALFIAIVLGGLYGILIIITGKRKNMTHFAFGPFLAIGCIVSMFWGNEILSWYLGQFL